MAVNREQFKQVLLGLFNPPATNSAEALSVAEKINEKVLIFPTASLSGAVATASTNGFACLMKTDRALKVKDIQLCPSGTVTSDNTNYASLSLQKNDAAGGAGVNIAVGNTTNTGATLALGTLAANTSYSLTVTAANATVNANQALIVSIIKPGSGVAIPAGSVIVLRYEEV